MNPRRLLLRSLLSAGVCGSGAMLLFIVAFGAALSCEDAADCNDAEPLLVLFLVFLVAIGLAYAFVHEMKTSALLLAAAGTTVVGALGLASLN